MKFLQSHRTLKVTQTQQIRASMVHDHRSKCFFTLSQVKLKDYHDTKQHESPRNFKVGDAVSCANIKPNKLDLKFSLAKHVIIETKARDKFRLVNVDTVNHVGSQCKVFKACA